MQRPPTLRPFRFLAVAALGSFLGQGPQWGQVPAAPVPQMQLPAVAAPVHTDTGCCGPVTPEGRHLRQILDGMDVDHLWQNHLHVDWETGQPDQALTYAGPDTHSHCSAFAAAVGERLGIYMLRPPEHPQQLLASAQGKWFASRQAQDMEWHEVVFARQAQTLANQGQLVVMVYVSPDPHTPGHIAIVRPAMKTDAALEADGPETTQAGGTNFSNGTARRSFALHPGAWPDGVKMYAHTTNFAAPPTIPATH
jgi:hypothetical protein